MFILFCDLLFGGKVGKWELWEKFFGFFLRIRFNGIYCIFGYVVNNIVNKWNIVLVVDFI